jgi:hypothetical protein
VREHCPPPSCLCARVYRARCACCARVARAWRSRVSARRRAVADRLTSEPHAWVRAGKGEAAEGEPALVLPVERLHLTVDTEKDNSFTLDDGAALFQMKASSREARDELQAAVKRAQEGHGDLAELRRLRANYTERVGKYALGELLGQGGFAKVKSGINWETGERVAAKIMPAHIAQDPQHKKEIVAMGSLNHPNVVKLLDIVYHPASVSAPGRIFLILELATGGELFSKVVDAGYLSERRARFYFRQLLQGVAYCHSHSLCHRDLKLENMLLDATGQTLKARRPLLPAHLRHISSARLLGSRLRLPASRRCCPLLQITDFGFAKNISLSGGGAEAKTILGTAVYVAPEVLDGKTYDGFKTDIWACGVVLFTMCVGRYPFDYGYHGGVGPSNPRNNMVRGQSVDLAC